MGGQIISFTFWLNFRKTFLYTPLGTTHSFEPAAQYKAQEASLILRDWDFPEPSIDISVNRNKHIRQLFAWSQDESQQISDINMCFVLEQNIGCH